MADGFVASVKDSIPFWYGGLPGVEIGQLDSNNLRSINEVLRNSIHIPADSFCESGFICLLYIHNVYIRSPTPGHYNSVGVRGESTIINKFLYHPVPDV